ncbi:MAG: trypsin-like peptidase domain-containing protein [Dehalococcoidia bacterium]
MSRRAVPFRAVTIAMVTLSLLIGACTDGSSNGGDAGATTATTTATEAATQTQEAVTPIPAAASNGAASFQNAVRNAVEIARPSAVQITTYTTSNGQRAPLGAGSGIVFDADGHVVTNNHVVADGSSYTVSLIDGRQFDATVVGQDPQTDVAVLQLENVGTEALPVATIGATSALQVGDWVVAIGNALGLEGGPTVTAGVVSAVGRTVQEPGSNNQAGSFLFDVIQTDTAINPGNSGGPLVNLQGEVVGLNTLAAGTVEPGVQAQNIGFAISIDRVVPLAQQLIETGSVVHPYLGISYLPLNAQVAADLGLETTKGALIGQVQPGSPADEAGLQADDIIVAFDGEALTGESDLPAALDAHKGGDTVNLEVERNGQTLTLQATLGGGPTG